MVVGVWNKEKESLNLIIITICVVLGAVSYLKQLRTSYKAT